MADIAKIKTLLRAQDFRRLFIEQLGWDKLHDPVSTSTGGSLTPIAEKRGFAVYAHQSGSIPDYAERSKIDRELAKLKLEHILVFSNSAKTSQLWLWVRRKPGQPLARREYRIEANHSGEAMAERLALMATSLDEEATLGLLEVTRRAELALNADRVTKRFYDLYQTEHDKFLDFIEGIPDERLERWYASIMLNRLMFIYFIQKKGFLANDVDYLRKRLDAMRSEDRFYADFLCPLFFHGFAQREGERDEKTKKLLGDVPYLNGGIFAPHDIEIKYKKAIKIPDRAFASIFAFFDQFRWHLDERPLRDDREINPDVLGYIFEKYINQKQMGAYYTKEDITEYIAKSCIIPFLFGELGRNCPLAFEGEGSVWRLTRENPDRYIYEPVRRGAELPLPDYIERGIAKVSERGRWNETANPKLALPTEIWRETLARRGRYTELKSRLAAGEACSIDDFVTYNLDLRQFIEDAVERTDSPELIRSLYAALRRLSVLDPTCGSGAFLFAALNVLEPIYESVLDRMAVFVSEADAVGRTEDYIDFRKILRAMSRHPDREYFIYKSIILDNLYGVDIMDEACEIAKLRLFLKLMSRVDSRAKLEPLPDIDFNIRAGNTLVGFASYEDTKKAVEGALDFDDTMTRIDRDAKSLGGAIADFRAKQEELGHVTASESAKAELRLRRDELNETLNGYLAFVYGKDKNKKKEYEAWKESHKPFHWWVEFYSVVRERGGFDIIIGNPPYVEYSEVKMGYGVVAPRTQSTNNLYAYILERCIGLTSSLSRFGMILPLSALATKNMTPLVNMLKSEYTSLWASFYHFRPSMLFISEGGHGANIATCIVIGGKNSKGIHSTGVQKWIAENRGTLFMLVAYTKITSSMNQGDFFIPKISNPIENVILCKIAGHSSISEYLQKEPNNNYLSYRTAGGLYWKVVVTFEWPHDVTSNKKSYFQSIYKRQVFACLLNSHLQWLEYCQRFDTFNFKDYYIFGLRMNYPGKEIETDLLEKCALLMKDYKANAQEKMRGSTPSYTVYARQSKSIIDDIDRVLARHYGFTEEELDYIINYDIKYRMGLVGGAEEEE
jgi:hypothetical protein